MSGLVPLKMDPKKIVREGYQQAGAAYLADRPQGSPDVIALDRLLERLPEGAIVLDAGCGAGVPIARRLSQSCRVVGVDFSAKQLALARKNAPEVALACQDLTGLGLAPESFDAICSYYAIIHIPREEHGGILEAFHRLLRPDGLVFLCLGAADIAHDIEEDFYGVRMYWSHYDATTYQTLLARAGFEVLWAKVIADSLGGEKATGGHWFVLAKKRPN